MSKEQDGNTEKRAYQLAAPSTPLSPYKPGHVIGTHSAEKQATNIKIAMLNYIESYKNRTIKDS